ncbi:MAG: type II toxin-antitoxin system RelE/ParE family toxin [Candidatus Marinimicrobia bacterium]|nr:type II toxin-antitoxin system RelE/ParE family toxin [Candidatus Neomarinimicrobiota bacterium]
MSKYRIFETDEFEKKLNKLIKKDYEFVYKKLIEYIYPQIIEEPAFGKNIKKLKGYNPETWRYRIGNYRIFYSISNEEKIVYIFTIDKRKDSYK